ncbi:MAG: HAMP domain-containing sensor histidine kinase [Longimicrobiales bacterium]
MTLRTAFALYVLLPLAALGAASMWLGGRAVESAVQARLEDDVALVARAIQLPLSRALVEGEGEQLYEALGSAFRIRRVYGAYVYDESGELVAEVGLPAGGVRGPEPARVAEEGRRGEYGEVGGRRVFSYFVPLTTQGGRIAGLLQVTRSRSDMEEVVGRVRVQVAGLFGGVWLLIAVLLLVAHQRVVGRHFRRLSAAMGRVESGARGERIEETGPREVVGMARSFNRMVAAVERAEREVEARRGREVELEERLRRSEKLAAIGRLAAGVAHELGTPLSVVDGTAQRLERSAEGDDGVAEASSSIRSAVRRMERIVRRLLEFGVRAAGDRERRDAISLLVSAATAVRGEDMAREVEVVVEEPDRPVEVVVDVRRLESALTHLLRNAVQAVEAGGVVTGRVREAGGMVEFVVDDDGPGVPDDIRDQLFEPFFTTKSEGEGSGLGLPVVHAVVEEHGGEVDVGTSPAGGARFVVRIPGDADG